ncbi:hypothetical protein GN956_G19905 [Arapaima gigas]
MSDPAQAATDSTIRTCQVRQGRAKGAGRAVRPPQGLYREDERQVNTLRVTHTEEGAHPSTTTLSLRSLTCMVGELSEPGLFNPDKALAYSVLSSYFTLVQLFHREALEDVLTAALVSFLASSGEIATHSLVDSKPPPGGAVTACD